MALNFTFLTEDQIWSDDAPDVMKRYGTKVAPTDLTVILGSWMTGEDDRTSEDDLTCLSWSASFSGSEDVSCVYYNGDMRGSSAKARDISARPALPPSEASKISPSEARAIAGIRVVEYGEYPQTVADDVTSEKLERLHKSKSLRPTGKSFTFDSADDDYKTSFEATSYQEYEMDGKRYIRVPGRPADKNSKLSTGKQVESGKPYWVEVQPIEWLLDGSGWMVAKKCLFAGIQFDTKDSLFNCDFSKTSIKHYLDTYFAKEIEPSQTIERTKRKEIANSVSKGGLKDFLASKAKRLDEVSKSVRKSLKEKGLTGKALHDTEQKERLKVSKAILKKRQGTK